MKNRNTQMSILTGIAIILVVLGHLDYQILSFGKLFPYYSYHVLIFVFISGYFYNPIDENNIGSFILRKAKNLLLPYFIWNIFYGILSNFLFTNGFIFCNKITVYNFFVEPFLGGHQYGLNFAAWFVPALFIIQIVNVVMRKVLGIVKLSNNWLVAVVCLALGIITVYLAARGHVWGLYKTPGRILFMLPVYEFGVLYKSNIEKKDTISSFIYFPVILIIQVLIVLYTDGTMNFSAVWCSGFASLPFIPYLTTLTGIALWLRISKLLSGCIAGKGLALVGDSSFQIMMHHPAMFMIVNLIAYNFLKDSSAAVRFDMTAFKENVNYVYLSSMGENWKLLYVVAGLFVPILLSKLIKKYKLPL